jgi:hypothetical protein
MKLVITLLIFLLGFSHLNATAQKKYVTDSIYYLVDTVHVPVKDRMINVYLIGTRIKCFEINCPCLSNGQKPILEYRTSAKAKNVSTEDLKKMKLVSLPDLIKKVKQHFEDKFDGIQVYYIIEPKDGHYMMHEAGITMPSKQQAINDHIIIKKPF